VEGQPKVEVDAPCSLERKKVEGGKKKHALFKLEDQWDDAKRQTRFKAQREKVSTARYRHGIARS
jgi:hypothetical protein